jgi:hypothetical protein
MSNTTVQSLSTLASHFESQLKEQLGGAWAAALSPADADLLTACSQDAAELTLRAMTAGPMDQKWLLREKAQINAQLMNLGAAAGIRASDAFWGIVRTALDGAVMLAIAAI